jgi:hypothetical protein
MAKLSFGWRKTTVGWTDLRWWWWWWSVALTPSLSFLSMWRDYVPDLRPTTSLLLIPANDDMVEWYIDRGKRRTRRKPVPVLLCPPQIPHELTQARTRASAVRGRRLTAWAITPSVTQFCMKYTLYKRAISYVTLHYCLDNYYDLNNLFTKIYLLLNS